MNPRRKAANPDLAVSSRFHKAFESVEAELMALTEAELVSVNIDVPKAITTVLGNLPEIVALRPAIVTQLPHHDIALFDKLETYALATAYTHGQFLASGTPQRSLAKQGARVAKERRLLLSDARALAARGLIDGTPLSALKGERGYRESAFELLNLVVLLRDNWEAIAGKTAVQLDDLVRAEHVAHELIVAVGIREQGPAGVNVASDQRQRAFTMMVKSYEEARRAVSYLRWHERDKESITPSLYAGRNTRRPKVPKEATKVPTEPNAETKSTVTYVTRPASKFSAP